MCVISGKSMGEDDYIRLSYGVIHLTLVAVVLVGHSSPLGSVGH